MLTCPIVRGQTEEEDAAVGTQKDVREAEGKPGEGGILVEMWEEGWRIELSSTLNVS